MSAAAGATAAAALNGNRRRWRGGGVSTCVAAAATAFTTVDGSRGRCRGGGVSASAAAAAPAAAALNGSRGRCRGGGASASAVAAATAAAAALMGAGVGAGAEETQQQRQSPQYELEPSGVIDGAAAATSATDRLIPAAERPTGDGTIPGGGSGAGTVATFTNEDVYLRMPQGCGALSGKVVKLGRSLYGLKQASRTWHDHLVRGMRSLGFEQYAADACVMRLVEDGVVSMVVVVHVNDIFSIGRKSR